MWGFCNVWVCVCMGFVMCGCFDTCVAILELCVFVFTVLRVVVQCFCIVSFMHNWFLFVLSIPV